MSPTAALASPETANVAVLRLVVTVLDLHLLSPASAPVIIALTGATAPAVGLALRSLLRRQSSGHPGGSAAEDSPPPCLASSAVGAGPGVEPGALVAISRLAEVLDRSRRLVAAEERVARELACADGWVIERYVLVGTHRVPFVLIGPSGIFAVCATDGAWTLYDLEVLSRLGDELRDRLPGYQGRVEAVVCLAFDQADPRAWYGGAD